jgi:hypothetical protein
VLQPGPRDVALNLAHAQVIYDEYTMNVLPLSFNFFPYNIGHKPRQAYSHTPRICPTTPVGPDCNIFPADTLSYVCFLSRPARQYAPGRSIIQKFL